MKELRVWSRAVDVLFPPQCAACGAIGSGFCARCAAALVPLSEIRDGFTVRGLGEYRGALRAAVLALKDGRRDVAWALGERIGVTIACRPSLVPVPTTAPRRRLRGMDGVVEIARAAARSSGASLCEALVHVKRDAQRGRTRSARLSARGRFATIRRFDGDEITLLDDVCTTGATLLDCASALRDAGAVVREAVVVAIAPNQHDP